MNAIPAKAAGVERIIMVTPAPGGYINPLVLAAAELAGVDEIWRIGGAQAVAALAYGTEKIRSVDVITGPGNAWVAEAKRQVFGVVGIDMVAGPSEIVVVADGKNDPDWIAADLLSQAEHDPTSQSILFTDSSKFAEQVAVKIDEQLAILATSETATTSWNDNGAIIVVDRFEQALPLIDRLAAEHLELAVDDPDALFRQIRIGVSGPPYTRSGRRLCCRSQSCPADRPPGAFLVRAVRDRLHEAHELHPLRRTGAGQYRAGGSRPRRSRRVARPCRQHREAAGPALTINRKQIS